MVVGVVGWWHNGGGFCSDRGGLGGYRRRPHLIWNRHYGRWLHSRVCSQLSNTSVNSHRAVGLLGQNV